jgi:hypothetical protein
MKQIIFFDDKALSGMIIFSRNCRRDKEAFPVTVLELPF